MGNLQARFRRFKRKPGSDLMLYRALFGQRLSPDILDEVEGAVFAIAPYTQLSKAQTQSIEVRETVGSTEEIFGPESQAAIDAFVVPADIKALFNERMYFDGVNDSVHINVVQYPSNTDTIVLNFSVISHINALTNPTIFTLGNSSTATQFIAIEQSSGGKLQVRVRDDAFYLQKIFVSTDNIATGSKVNVSISLDLSGSLSVTIDGVEETGTFTAIGTVTLNQASIGSLFRSNQTEYFQGVISDVEYGVTSVQNSYNGYGNTNADWEDQIGTNDGTVNGSPALFTGQGFDGRIATAYNAGSEAADALQPVMANQPFIATAGVLEAGMRFDGVDDRFTFTLATTVTGTIIVGTTEGIYAAESTLAAGTYSLSAKGVSTIYLRSEMNVMISAILFNRTLSAAEIAKVKAAMVAGGAVESFGSVANFRYAWNNCSSLKSFPLLNTSSGTSFFTAWLGCSSLTSFPLLNTAAGTSFDYAWYNCTSLTDFPANFFDAWNPAFINSRVFNLTWDGCTSLTSTSVENILTSLDTSGKYGTNTGLSTGTVLADNTIDIDYDGSPLPAATETAITNLYNKRWQVTINGALYFAPESLAYFAAAETLDANAFDQTAVDPTQTADVNKGQINTVVKELLSASLWTPLVEAWWFRDISFTALPAKLKYESDADLTLNNYISADYLSEGTDPGLLGNSTTKTEMTTYSGVIAGSIAVFTSNGSFYGECSIPASYTSSQYNLGRKEALFIFNRALTSGERTSLETIMVAQGARPFGLKAGVTSLVQSFRGWAILTSFDDSWYTGSVTDFQSAWESNSLTSFPLLDTSSGTNFIFAWRNNSLASFPLIDTSSGSDFGGAWAGNSLTSFPLLNTSSGKNFGFAWVNNSLLTDFPANFFDTWNPASIASGVFELTWDGCTSLTSTSVENILTSLDTSGKYGTNTGLSTGTVLADNTIDIDYDASGLTAATSTAITNLKAKDWQVTINGVLI